MLTGNVPKLQRISISENQELPLLIFPSLEQTGIVKHGFTTRLGGVSEGIFSTLNLSFTRGDKREAVEENYRRLAKALQVEYGSFVFSDQTHTTNVIRVGREDAGNGILRERPYTDVDGMVTNEPGITLVTFYADCVPLYFVDPVHRAIGLSHSGWRGTVGRMGKVTLEKMRQEFGTDPADVICAIGPSICQDCYEVSEDVAGEFQREFAGKENEILQEQGNPLQGSLDAMRQEQGNPLQGSLDAVRQEQGDRKFQLDLWKANEIVLLEAGIKKEHLTVTEICTCCNPKLLFSHRASKGKRGNLAAVLALREKTE